MLTPLGRTSSCRYKNRSLGMHDEGASLLRSSCTHRKTALQLYNASGVCRGAYVSCDGLDLALFLTFLKISPVKHRPAPQSSFLLHVISLKALRAMPNAHLSTYPYRQDQRLCNPDYADFSLELQELLHPEYLL